jgi:hypothetical protein
MKGHDVITESFLEIHNKIMELYSSARERRHYNKKLQTEETDKYIQQLANCARELQKPWSNYCDNLRGKLGNRRVTLIK